MIFSKLRDADYHRTTDNFLLDRRIKIENYELLWFFVIIIRFENDFLVICNNCPSVGRKMSIIINKLKVIYFFYNAYLLICDSL